MTPPRIQEAWSLMRRHLQAPPGREVGAPDASGFPGFSATAEHTCASRGHQVSRRNEYIERTGRHMGEYYLAMKRSGARSLSTPWTWLDATGTEGQGRAWPSGQGSGASESRGRRQIRGRRGWAGSHCRLGGTEALAVDAGHDCSAMEYYATGFTHGNQVKVEIFTSICVCEIRIPTSCAHVS